MRNARSLLQTSSPAGEIEELRGYRLSDRFQTQQTLINDALGHSRRAAWPELRSWLPGSQWIRAKQL